ncbi:MAG: hypothetical protein HW419_4382 [Deltaproteobacteria bacterium]|nr:hypothetical protein [Deltaproteobacteria bacterium]
MRKEHQKSKEIKIIEQGVVVALSRLHFCPAAKKWVTH